MINFFNLDLKTSRLGANLISNGKEFHISTIGHFTVVCLVAWPWNEREAGVDLVLIETSLLFLCKFLLIRMEAASLTYD